MKLVHIEISNFRSVGSAAFACFELTSLIGPNNSGKSNLLRALRWALEPNQDLVASDFPVIDLGDRLDVAVQVTLRFQYANDSERAGYSSWSSLHDLTIRRTHSSAAPKSHYEVLTEVPEQEDLREGNMPTTRQGLAGVPYGTHYIDPGKLVRSKLDALRREYIETNRSSLRFITEFSPLTIEKERLPSVLLLPAVRDLADMVGESARSVFRRHVAAQVRRHLELVPDVAAAVAALNAAFQKLGADSAAHKATALASLEEDLAERMKDWNVKFDIGFANPIPPELGDYFQMSTSIAIDDGKSTPPEEKGHGLQRAFILELLRLEAELEETPAHETPPRLQLLLVEEPELYLHPQKQRALASKLRRLAESSSHQVILTTHSDAFVDLGRVRSIVRVTRKNGETALAQCEREIFDESQELVHKKHAFNMAYWFSQGRAQMLFARRAVFVEGQTEVALLGRLAEILDIYDPEVAVVDCGSKDNIALYCEVATAFSVPFMVVHDEDPVNLLDPANALPCEGCESRRQAKHVGNKNSFAKNERIAAAAGSSPVFVISPEIETAAEISKSQGKRISKPLAAIERYALATAEEIPEKLADVVKAIYR